MEHHRSSSSLAIWRPIGILCAFFISYLAGMQIAAACWNWAGERADLERRARHSKSISAALSESREIVADAESEIAAAKIEFQAEIEKAVREFRREASAALVKDADDLKAIALSADPVTRQRLMDMAIAKLEEARTILLGNL